eukprot:Gb_20968 [translate_table: standard]
MQHLTLVKEGNRAEVTKMRKSIGDMSEVKTEWPISYFYSTNHEMLQTPICDMHEASIVGGLSSICYPLACEEEVKGCKSISPEGLEPLGGKELSAHSLGPVGDKGTSTRVGCCESSSKGGDSQVLARKRMGENTLREWMSGEWEWGPMPFILKKWTPFFICETGGSSGIGFGIAKEALLQGAFVTLIARNPSTLDKAVENLVEEIKVNRDRICTKIADVGNYEMISMAIKQSFQWKAIDVLVCNAGVARTAYLDEAPIQDLHAIIGTNLTGVINTLHAALPLMKQRSAQPSSVVLVSSLAALVPA